ncbi:GNAT family N-acetyltransferase [Geminocystis sp.]|jgi:GNAT superfamily N-acetyltransferase|uniref:GNAT family N-acetyltransferase n=1 Tax=Geminocystis sp. TaxID=2664100 RepID=UPI003594337C
MVWLQKLFTKTDNENNISDKVYDRDWVTLDQEIFGRSKVFFSTTQDIDLYELEELCDSVGWARRPLRKVRKALDNSYLVASAWEVKGAKTVMIGFARATSDHSFNATIWDVVIHPRFQKKGLGKTFMKYIIKKLRSDDISNVTLFADPQVVDFYRRLGFVLDPEGIKGMFWYPD